MKPVFYEWTCRAVMAEVQRELERKHMRLQLDDLNRQRLQNAVDAKLLALRHEGRLPTNVRVELTDAGFVLRNLGGLFGE
jgi:uncharacterized membrane protein